MTMRCPSVKRLVAHFPNLTPKDARLIRKLAKVPAVKLAEVIQEHCPKTHEWIRSCYGSPLDTFDWRTHTRLRAIDEVMGTYGVEALGPEPSNPSTWHPFEYLNTGDTYNATLIYSRQNGAHHLFISSWGDVVEHHPEWERKQHHE